MAARPLADASTFEIGAVIQRRLESLLLPHVFRADVTRWAVRRYEADAADSELATAFAVLDVSFAAGLAEDTELIAASFLENLPAIGEDGAGVREMLGPALTNHLERFG